MVSIQGTETSIQYWPGASMSRFGLNPYGDPLYRVIWSDSRKEMIGGRWGDSGTIEYRWIPRYEEHCWILEKWLSPIQYAGTPESYNLLNKDSESGLLTCGPYPHRGEYERCFTFPVEPTLSVVERVIWMLRQSQGYSLTDKKIALKDQLKAKKKQFVQRGADIWRDSQLLRNHTEKELNSVKFKKSAHDLGLPVGDGKFFGGR